MKDIVIVQKCPLMIQRLPSSCLRFVTWNQHACCLQMSVVLNVSRMTLASFTHYVREVTSLHEHIYTVLLNNTLVNYPKKITYSEKFLTGYSLASCKAIRPSVNTLSQKTGPLLHFQITPTILIQYQQILV